MLSQEEIKNISASLRKMLNEHGFDWLLVQVEDEIVRGREQTVSVKEINLNETYFEVIDKKSIMGNEKFVIAEAYSLEDELQLLLAAIHKGICEPFQMANSVLDFVSISLEGKPEFVLVPERSGEQIVISAGQLQLLNEKSLKLFNLVREIENELNNATT